MRRDRLIITAAALVLGVSLSGCETSNMSDKIQDTISDMNLFGTAKKPLPGDRKDVFPGGVPGVTQGVPPDLVKGNQTAAVEPDPAPAPPPRAAPPPKKKKVTVAAVKKKPATHKPPSGPKAAPNADDGVWPPPPNASPPAAEEGVWPAPPR
jgi:hypothetical protein